MRYTPAGGKAQSVTCLTEDPGVTSSIPALSHKFMENDHEIISTAFLLPYGMEHVIRSERVHS